MQIAYASQPHYPAGRGVTPLSSRIHNHAFSSSLTLDEAATYLEDEIGALGVSSAVIGTAYDQLRNDRQRRMIGSDSAASVVLHLNDRQAMFVCDRWSSTEQNLYALHLGLRAMRNLDQWGVLPVAQFLSGLSGASGSRPFQERRRSAGALPQWMTMLGLGPGATLKDANAVYRSRVKEWSDDEHKLQDLNAAIDEARRALGGGPE